MDDEAIKNMLTRAKEEAALKKQHAYQQQQSLHEAYIQEAEKLLAKLEEKTDNEHFLSPMRKDRKYAPWDDLVFAGINISNIQYVFPFTIVTYDFMWRYGHGDKERKKCTETQTYRGFLTADEVAGRIYQRVRDLRERVEKKAGV